MNGHKRTSPWVWVGCGCGALVILVMAVFGVIAYLGWRTAKDLEAGFRDPETQKRRIQEVLGTGDLPEGYYPVGGISIPFLMDMAMLTDREPEPVEDPEQAFGERAFLYMKLRTFGRQRQDFEDFFDGRTDRTGDLPIDLGDTTPFSMGDAGEVVVRGSFSQGEVDLRYVALRSDTWIEGRRVDSLVTLILVDCPVQDRTRLGVWFVPAPELRSETETEGEPYEIQGTIADESILDQFLGHFDLCT